MNNIRVTNVGIVKAIVAGHIGFNDTEESVDGVFAVSKDKQSGLIHFYIGDDGWWKKIFSFHPHWIPSIVNILNMIELLGEDNESEKMD